LQSRYSPDWYTHVTETLFDMWHHNLTLTITLTLTLTKSKTDPNPKK